MRGVCRAIILSAAALGLCTGCSLFIDTDVGVRDGQDAGPGDGDGGGGEADAGPDRCGTVGRLQDDFQAAELSPAWMRRSHGIGDLAPVSGKLQVEVAQGAGEPQFAEALSFLAYDMRGEAVTARVDSVDAIWQSSVEVRQAGIPGLERPKAGMKVVGTNLQAFSSDGQDDSVIRSAAYQPTAHRYWRMREAAGSIAFETAAEDLQFQRFAMLDRPGFDPAAVVVALEVWTTDASVAGSAVLQFDDVDQGAEALPACPSESLSDDFTDPVLGSQWMTTPYAACSIATGTGQLELQAQGGSLCRLVQSARGYTMVGGRQLTIEVAALPADPDSALTVSLTSRDDTYLALRQRDGELAISLVVDGVDQGSPVFGNPVSAQWWRFTEASGDLRIEISSDGKMFDLLHTVVLDGALDLSQLRLIFQMQTGASAATAVIGGVNAPP